jgi:carbonic anhydrase/acetyltransferase-like protein (isoleucine patch superfamily)
MASYDINSMRPTLPADGSCWIAPSADVIGDVTLGRETGVWFGAVIRADNTPITIGARTNVQENAVLHSDPGIPLVIGDGVTVGHRAILHGCMIGNNVLVGMGATILNNVVIGDDCLIGAGALVTEGKTFPPGSLIVGVPAQVKRQLSPEAIADIRVSADGYCAKAAAYAAGLIKLAD